jgi:phosphohistidine phosphatase
VELYLLRHAHAGDPAKWHGDDAARPLSKKGRAQAERLGAFLVARGIVPDVIVTSPKLRALQTAQLVAAALDLEPLVDERLGQPLRLAGLSAVIAESGERDVVVVGHDPDFSDLAAQLIGASELRMRKGAIARFDVDLPLTAACATLRWLLPPDLLD